MATSGKPKSSKTKQQSLSLSSEVIDVIEEEARRTGIAKSQYVDRLIRDYANTSGKPTIITVMSFKGGVGKTTTSACLAVCLGQLGHKVLIIDLDGQGNISQYFGVYDPRAEEKCIADVMLSSNDSTSRLTLDDVKRETEYENVSIVPSSFRFSGADTKMSADNAAGVDSRLRFAIEDLHDNYDYIIIDCPPSLNLTVTNAIIALEAGNRNSCIIIPVRIDGFAIAGVDQTISTIERIAKERRKTPQTWRILRTLVERRTKTYNVGMAALKNIVSPEQFFTTIISKATIVPESSLAMQPLVLYDPESQPAQEYKALANEIEDLNV